MSILKTMQVTGGLASSPWFSVGRIVQAERFLSELEGGTFVLH